MLPDFFFIYTYIDRAQREILLNCHLHLFPKVDVFIGHLLSQMSGQKVFAKYLIEETITSYIKNIITFRDRMEFIFV